MEEKHKNLQKAIERLPNYEPDKVLWNNIADKLNELPLNTAVRALPQYEPDDKLWELIAASSSVKRPAMRWWHFAAAIIMVGISISMLTNVNNTKPDISFSIEKVDARLQNNNLKPTDPQYQRLKAYCETNTLVCNSKDYKLLQTEYEKLNDASVQLKQTIGEYNTEVELVKQYIFLENQKANILNEMAKMI